MRAIAVLLLLPLTAACTVRFSIERARLVEDSLADAVASYSAQLDTECATGRLPPTACTEYREALGEAAAGHLAALEALTRADTRHPVLRALYRRVRLAAVRP